MVRMIAGLGGFLNRKSDGFPGPKTLWIGRVLPAVVRELRRFVRDDLSLGEHRLDKMSLFLDRNL